MTLKPRRGAPKKDPRLLKIPVGYKLPRWLVGKLRGSDTPAAQLIEGSLREAQGWEPPG